MDKYTQNLKKYFWFDDFRFTQREIVESVVEGNNTLVFMPTGWWKSLTYQLPALMMDGLAIVISPLISLMKDQVDALRERGISAELINSTIDFSSQQNILNEISKNNNSIKFLYIAPERLNSSSFLRVLQNVKISLIAIDEAHCISQWGHDFRPSYMKVKDFIKNLKNTQRNPSTSGEVRWGFPVMWLTATATQKVKKDIVERLDLDWVNMFTSGFDRKNIILIVREISKKDEKKEKVFEILKKTPWSGIVYCSSRKAVDEVYDFLIETWVKAGKYTGAMTPEVREDMQNKFMSDEYKVVVATNAFWMWIDKKDIRFVIHYNLPWSIENYYQEVWRAWRDWKNSFWVVLASYWDTKIQEFFIENSNPPKKEILDFYDYLHWLWEKEILKTQYVMAEESNLNNAMKVWTILKILEKYWIVKKWVEDSWDFRGRWVTLIQEKREHSHIMIDWKHQVQLEDEAYFKLEQVKKMLFYPHCRRKFILEYFGDWEDLDKIWDNCGTCDFCIDSKKFANWEIKDLVPLSVFWIVLDSVKEFDNKFWVVMFMRLLTWSQEKKLLDAHLDESDFYWALEDYKRQLVKAVIQSLIDNKFLFQSEGQYPMLWLTELWESALYKEDYIKEKNRELQQVVYLKYKEKSEKASPHLASPKGRGTKGGNYKKTLELFNSWKSIFEISEIIWFKERTVEWHLLKLYESWELDLAWIMKTINFSNIKHIKKVLVKHFPNWFEFLKDVKSKCIEEWQDVERNEISVCKIMMEKKDI